MKKLLTILSALVLVASCAKAPQQAIIGTWDVIACEAMQGGQPVADIDCEISYFIFSEGGIGRTDTFSFTWSIIGDELIVRTDMWATCYTIVEPPRRTMTLSCELVGGGYDSALILHLTKR